MRQGQQNRRGRGRGRKGQNPLARSYESNGPDVKVRGTASHVAEKYMTLARDAISSGDIVLAENYLQHAEHYNRIIMAAQVAGQPPNGHNGQRMRSEGDPAGGYSEGDSDDDDYDDGEGEQLTGAMLAQEQPRMFDTTRPNNDRDRQSGNSEQPRAPYTEQGDFDRPDRFHSPEQPQHQGERNDFRGGPRQESRGDRGHQQRNHRHRRRFDNSRNDGGNRPQGNGSGQPEGDAPREGGSFDEAPRRRPNSDPVVTTPREPSEDN